MEAEEAIFSAIKARFVSDTGPNGLQNASAAGYVRTFLREGSPLERQPNPWPKIVVRVTATEMGVPKVQTSVQGFDAVVEFDVETNRDTEFDTIDRVENAIRERFHNQTLDPLVDSDDAARTWRFAPMGRLTPNTGPGPSPTGKTLHRIVRYRVVATKGVT